MITVIPDALFRWDTEDTSTNIRLGLIRAGLEAFKDAPWFGHGWGSIISATHPHMGDWLFSRAEGFDYLLADREAFRTIGFFAERGVARVAGREFTDLDTEVFLYVPAGAAGPKFLMTRNYLVFKGYNFSDSYAMAVAHLTDRLKGAGPFVASWPRGAQFPDRQQRIDIQRLGYYGGVVDGNIGPVTQAAYARFQADAGLVADGFVTREAHRLLASAVQ